MTFESYVGSVMVKKKGRTQPRKVAKAKSTTTNPFEARTQTSKKPVLNTKIRGNVVKPGKAQELQEGKSLIGLATTYCAKNDR